MKTLNEVEQFICKMKKAAPKEIETVFYYGFCYWLAFILADRFKGDIWFNSEMVHFACMIQGELYDIYGKVIPGISPISGEPDGSENAWTSWESFQFDNHEQVEMIVKTCIKKIGGKNGSDIP